MRFECQKCGECCRDFGGGFLPLWEWETEKLKELAKEKNIPINLQPFEPFFDKRSEMAFCLQFKLVQEPCPFLIDNQCSIYEKRPIICKCFPLAENHLFKSQSEKTTQSSFGLCPNFDAEKFLVKELGANNITPSFLKKEDSMKKYKETFGKEMYIFSFQKDNIIKGVDYIMRELIKNKKIKLRKISKFDYDKYKIYPFFEFLARAKLMSEESKEKLIRDFQDEKRAEDIINSVEN